MSIRRVPIWVPHLLFKNSYSYRHSCYWDSLLPSNTSKFWEPTRVKFSDGNSFCSGSIPSSTHSCNLRMSELGRCQNIKEARRLFDGMPHRDVGSYGHMINLYLKSGDFPSAELLFKRMSRKNVVVESVMVHGYAKVGRIDDARKLFDQMPVKNVFTWTSLVSGYLRIGLIHEARCLFDEMPFRNVVTWTTMFLGYARNGLILEARDLFDQMPEKNVVSWTAMIKSYIENGKIDEARKLFDEMPHSNLYSWNVMILGYLDNKQPNEAINLFQVMPQRNEISWTTMVTGLARMGLTEEARKFFDLMPKKDVAAWNAMITAYANEGNMSEARDLFESMPEEGNVITWNAMIDGYTKIGYQEEALRHLLLLLQTSIKPNETTLSSVLIACGSIMELLQIHALVTQLGFETDTSVTNALVTMYSRIGDLGSAHKAFEKLMNKDVISWTAMILAFSNHGFGDYALQVFSRMLRYRIQPDGITYIGVLSACSHAGLVEKGKRLFDSMTRAYGLEPRAEHYSCLVDLMGRAGQVEEAMRVVSQMPPEELDEVVLGALLGACKVHGEIELGSRVGQELIDLDPDGSGGYVLLANAYASRQQWSEMARVRKLMKERRVKKVPGYSQIEVKLGSHVFYVGDRSHSQAEEIYEMLEEKLLPRMKEMGYLQKIQSLHT